MKIYFENTKELTEGIALLADELSLTLCPKQEADWTVTVQPWEKTGFALSFGEKRATIRYGGGRARFFRALAILVYRIRKGETEGEITQTPLFEKNGPMMDVSRNAVLNVDTVCLTLRKIALMGMNTYMLYTEDTYEIPDYPYFGYMRGRYTKEELKYLDQYAGKLGIELIPCIQTLGHLESMLRWHAAAPYRDTARVMLAQSEKTYRLIDAMLQTVSECFTTRRVHVGLDETKDMGFGQYFLKNGYREQSELYLEHLNVVAGLLKKHGLKGMMWSDMFFRLSGRHLTDFIDYDPRVTVPEEGARRVPEGMQQVFWDYYHTNEEFYDVNLKHHKVFGDDTVFAGGVWLWSGFAPCYTRSLLRTIPALDACRKNGVKEVVATVWHTGSEACLITSLLGFSWYADYDYLGRYDEESVKECFAFSCNADYDEVLLFDRTALPYDGRAEVSRALVYNDPLIGLCDKHLEGLDTKSFYSELLPRLKAEGKGELTPALRVLRAMCDLLIHKADFGLRLKKAYDAKDNGALDTLATECDRIREKLQTMRDLHRDCWMRHNKPFGWEVHDIRYGGLLLRFDTAKERILAYTKGEIDKIDELEQERLLFDEPYEKAFSSRFLGYGYASLATPCLL